MVPDKFNMVDMEGIDIILNLGEEVPGIYQKLVESIAQCRYQCLYNWKSDEINIPPTFIELVVDPYNGNIPINTGVYITPEDIIQTNVIQIGEEVVDPFPLPDGYSLPLNCKKLLYAESSSEQICDTGVHPTLETKIEIAGYFIPGTYGEYKILTGCKNPTINIASNGITDPTYWGFGNRVDFATMWSSLNGIPICTISKTEGRIQNPPFPDVHKNCGATSMSGSSDTTIAIFGRYDGRTAERLSPMRFFRERIWEDDVLIRCIFPILKNEEEVCLYDVINGIYMPNLGTAPLVGGLSL